MLEVSTFFFFFFFFPGVLWSFGDLFSVYLVSLAARDAFLSSYIFFLLYWLYKEERRFIIFFFLGQSKHGRLFMSWTHGWFRPLVGCRGGDLGGDWRRRDFHLSDVDLHKIRVQILWAGVTALVSFQLGSWNILRNVVFVGNILDNV